jgi:antitoxin YefM
MPETLDISEARKQLNTMDQKLEEQPVIIVTRHSKEAFAFVNLDHLSAIMETMEILTDKDSMDNLRKALEDIREGRVRDHDDVEKELG